MTPSTTFWCELLAGITAAVAAATAVGAILSWRIREAVWRRTVWQIVVAGSLLLLLAECSGACRVLTFWLKSSRSAATEKPRSASVQVIVRDVPTVEAEPSPEAISLQPSPLTPLPRQLPLPWPGLVWAGGSTALGVWRLLQGVAFFRVRRRMRAVTDPELAERVHGLGRRLGVRRHVRLLASDRLAGPIAFGAWRPTIGLPTAFARDFTPAQRDAMLAHELAHLAAHDPFWQHMASLLVTLLWWHPLAWWARRQLQVTSEMAADEASLLVENGPDALAESLVVLGRRLVERPAPGWLGVEGMGFRSGLGRRVERLLRLTKCEWIPLSRGRAWFVRFTSLAGLLTLAMAVTAWTQPHQAASTLTQAWDGSLAGRAWAVLLKSTSVRALARAEASPPSSALLPPPQPPLAAASATNQTNAVAQSTRSDDGSPPLWTRCFKVDTNALLKSLQSVEGNAPAGLGASVASIAAFQRLLRDLGVALDPPKSFYYGDIRNWLVVRATQEDFQTIEQGLEALGWARPVSSDDFRDYFAQRARQLDTGPVQPAAGSPREAKPAPAASANRPATSLGRQALEAKLERIVFPTVHFKNCSLGEAIEELTQLARVHDPDRLGLNFIVSSALPSRDAPGRVDPGTGLPRDTETAVPLQDMRLSFGPEQNIWLQNVTLQQVLRVLLAAAGTPLKYSVEEYAVVLGRKDIGTAPLYTRFFKVDWTRLHRELGLSPDETASRQPGPFRLITTNSATVIPRFREHLRGLGVDLTTPKAMFCNDRLQMLVARATLRDLDAIETALQKLNPPPQVIIEVKLCEFVSTNDDGVVLDQLLGETAGLDLLLGGMLTNSVRQAAQPGSTNAALATATLILTDRQLRAVLRGLEQRSGVDVLVAPKITTLSGRQAQVKVVDVTQVVTGLQSDPAPTPLQLGVGTTNTASGSRPFSEPVELGPMIDVVPQVLADGHTIQMNVTAAVREMLGYDTQPEAVWDYVAPGNTPTLSDLRSLPPSIGPDRVPSTVGSGGGMPVGNRQPKPLIRVREAQANLNVWDGQTLVLCGGSTFIETRDNGRWIRRPWPQPAAPKTHPKKRLLVFITPTIVDPAGNRLHADEEFPQTENRRTWVDDPHGNR